jgi:hypothetical protein
MKFLSVTNVISKSKQILTFRMEGVFFNACDEFSLGHVHPFGLHNGHGQAVGECLARAHASHG